MNELTFDVVSDVARAVGLVYTLSEELRVALRSNNKALPGINGDKSWELPLPATYVIAWDGRIALASIDIDYWKRLEPEANLAALHSLQPAFVCAVRAFRQGHDGETQRLLFPSRMI